MDETAVVLVTGASGYLSTHVIKQLQEAGHKVRGTVRSTKDEKKVKHLHSLCPGAKHDLELVEADLTEEAGWDAAVSGCEFVHHVASPFVMANPRNEEEIIKPAVEGTLLVLKACARAGTVKRVILTSSVVSVLNRGGNSPPATEANWADPAFPGIVTYNKSKILAEKAAWDYVKSLPDAEKFELAVINPAMILGPALHGTPGTSTDVIRQILQREMPMVPKLSLTVADVRDCAAAHLACMTKPQAAGNRHIICTKTLWMTEVAQILDKEFRPQGYNCPTKQLPGCLLTVASWFDPTLRSAKSFSKEPMQLDNTRMTEVLGITPTSCEKTLIDMGYSLIDNGFVKKTNKYTGRT